MSPSSLAWRYASASLLKVAAGFAGGFRAKEKLGLILPPWHAYGLLAAADHAQAVGVSTLWAIEFGVAAGRGLRQLKQLTEQVTRVTGVRFRIAGFDTGKGMPRSNDYRDHPEKYREGDYPMFDEAKLKRDLGAGVELIVGDIDNTVDGFRDRLTRDCPVGFVAVDVDIYSSTKSALRLFDGDAELYLPMTFCYFDDCANRSHFNRFAGELLAIDEFTREHELRKLDIDRGIWNSHRNIGPQLWHTQLFILHVFDHPWRTAQTERRTKVIPE